MNTSDPSYRGSVNVGTIAATFSDRESAKKALTELHDAGFRSVWLGVTHGDATSSAGATVASDDAANGGIMNSLGRFFSGEGAQEQALHQALIAHGLSDDQAWRVEATVPAGTAIVTVDAENDADEALETLQMHGGNAVTNSVTAASPKTAPSAGAAGQTSRTDVDQARRLQLREERLLIDKQRVASGEARIRKEVVSKEQSVDVPVFHEELFIQRRPVTDGGTALTTPIGGGEEIRVPLSEERVDVQKRTVVTEEVEVGKRKIEGMEHVSDTVRYEELRVDDNVSPKSDDPGLRGR